MRDPGLVAGSVSMTDEKKKVGAYKNNGLNESARSSPRSNVKYAMPSANVPMNAHHISKRWILRTTRRPPASTNGTIQGVPIHQLADSPRNAAVAATPSAAGLKMCFFRIARIYLDAIAIADAQNASGRYVVSKTAIGGVMMSARMSAVIQVDSGLYGVSNESAKIRFVVQQMTNMNAVENAIETGLYESTPK